MGQEPAFLLVHHLAEGLDQLLAFLADANQRDALNAFLKLRNRRDCIRTVADHCFPDGVWFELSVVSDDGPRCSYQFWLKWLWSDPDPSSDKLFDVTILPKSRMGPQPGDSQVMQACWEALQERSIRRLLDPFTRARLFLPEEFSETTVLGMLAQLVLLACRKGSLITRNDTGRGPASVFRDHVNRIAPGYFKDYQGKALAEAARYEIMDTVFKRLYLDAQPGQGFMAA